MTIKDTERDDIGVRVTQLQTPHFPKEVPAGKDTVQLYDGTHISADDAVWLPGCYFPAPKDSYTNNIRIA